MNKLPTIIIALIVATAAFAAPPAVNDVKVSQAVKVSPPTFTDRVFSPVANSLFGFDSSVLPVNVTIGSGLALNSTTHILSGTGSSALAVLTVATLRSASVSGYSSGQQATVSYYSSIGDGGGGVFIYSSASAVADNGGTVIAPAAGSGRWLRQFSGPINVHWFGAKGDTVTVDKDAIQNAINLAVSQGGGDVYLPAGTYTADGLSAIGNGISIVGDGRGISIITSPSGTADVISFGDTNAIYLNNKLRNISVLSSVNRTAGTLIKFTNCNIFDVRGFNTYRGFKHIEIINSGVGTITDGYMSLAFSSFLLLNGSSDQYISDTAMDGTVAPPPSGILVMASTGLWMDTVGVVGCQIGLLLQPSAGASISNTFTKACAYDFCTTDGVRIDAAAGTTVQRIQSVGDWGSSNSGNGLSIIGAGTITGLDFNSFRAYTNGLNGFKVTAGANMTFNNCRACGNSALADNISDGMIISAGVSKFQITGGRYGMADGFEAVPNRQRNGIIVSVGASNNYMITNVDATNNATAGVSDGGTGVSKVVTNNLP